MSHRTTANITATLMKVPLNLSYFTYKTLPLIQREIFL